MRNLANEYIKAGIILSVGNNFELECLKKCELGGAVLPD